MGLDIWESKLFIYCGFWAHWKSECVYYFTVEIIVNKIFHDLDFVNLKQFPVIFLTS